MGFDGLELACWGDHFDVYKAAESSDYCRERWRILTNAGLSAFTIANHLVGQAICDNIDERHQAILPPQVWGDGDPEGVRQRAAENMKTAAKACRQFLDTKPRILRMVQSRIYDGSECSGVGFPEVDGQSLQTSTGEGAQLPSFP